MPVITDIINKRDQIISIATRYKTSDIKVFGSVIREEETSESDIDFLVECQDDCSLFDIISLKNDLEDFLGRRIDVVTNDSLHWSIKDKVLQEARPL